MIKIWWGIWSVTVPLISAPISYYNLQPSRDFTGIPLPTRQDYLSRYPPQEFRVYHLEQFISPRVFLRRDRPGRLVLASNSNLYRTLESHFRSWAEDLSDEGYDVILASIQGGTPEELKEFIRQELGDDGEGVILCGNLPLAWFENYEHFYDEHRPDRPRMEEYPIDLFFMDLDGEWEDTSGNGIYDLHSGEWEPDIWLGRVAAYNLYRVREDTLIQRYIERVRRYRRGELSLPHQGLAFIDDDWIPWSHRWRDNLTRAWGLTRLVAHPESTSAGVYRYWISEPGCEMVLVAVHSTTDSHGFLVENRSRYDYFRYRHLRDEVSANVFFFNLFACSVMNLARELALGPLYALKGPFSLGAVGPAKVGGMLFFEDFFRPLGEGYPIGEAFRRWLSLHAREPGHPNWARSWFYGMTYFGDPTLRIPLGVKIVNFSVEESHGGDRDDVLDAGERARINLTLKNRGNVRLRDGVLYGKSEDFAVQLLVDSLIVGDLEPDEEVILRGLEIQTDINLNDEHPFSLNFLFVHRDGHPWGEKIDLIVRAPSLEITGLQIWETEGDGDALWEEGERGQIRFRIKNNGGDDVRGSGEMRLWESEGSWDMADTVVSFPATGANGEVWSDTLAFFIRNSPRESVGFLLSSELWASGVKRGENKILIPYSPEWVIDEHFDLPPLWGKSYAVREGYSNVWRWDGQAGQNNGVIAFGGPDTLTYPPLADGVYELPLVIVAPFSQLSLKHKMTAEPEYDGGLIEANWGRGWERLVPDGGYNGQSVNNGSFPGGECWTGSFDWRWDHLSLGNMSGAVRIRLRFGSDEGLEMAGWFIDQIIFTSHPQSVSGTPIPISVGKLFTFYPNPTNSSINIKLDAIEGNFDLKLFDFQGRFVGLYHRGTISFPNRHNLTNDFPTVNWDLSYLPAGVYIISARHKDFIQREKIILLK